MRYDAHYRLAHELGKHLHEIMGWDGPLTHRQFVLWHVWLHEQMNIPTRDNYYQMQIACEQRRMFAKNPRSIKVDSFKLQFGGTNGKQLVSQQDAIDQMKQRFVNRMTAPVTVRNNGEVIDTITPAPLKRQKLLEEQAAKLKAQQKKKPKPPTPKTIPHSSTSIQSSLHSTSTQEKAHGDDAGARGIARPNDGRRSKIRQNAGRRKKSDGE